MKLAEGVERYIQRKRDGGLIYKTAERNFGRLVRQLGHAELDQVTPADILQYLNTPRSAPITWQLNYRFLKNFFEFWSARGIASTLTMPPPRPIVRQTSTPYVYSHGQIRALLKATSKSQKHRYCVIPAQTLRMLLLTMYAVGANVGELLDVRVPDLMLKTGLLKLKGGGRHGRARHIPICPDLQDELQQFLRWRSKNVAMTDHLFLNVEGYPLVAGTVGRNFRVALKLANVQRSDGARYVPRLRDLRHTFAVHRITSWIRNGADLNRMLPALAAYLGQAELGSAEKYLWLAPERFRKELNKLSPAVGKRRWREDKALMGFLASL